MIIIQQPRVSIVVDEFPLPGTTDPLKICPDYDEECHSKMDLAQAQWCYNGMCNHPCGGIGAEGIGKPDGYCPIIANHN